MILSRYARCAGVLALGFAWSAPAAAQARRMVVRLQAGTEIEAPVKVVLTGPDGSKAEATLKDDGSSPDVTASDGVWSSTIEATGDTVGVELVAGSRSWQAGEVSWSDPDAARDLELIHQGDSVVAKAIAVEGGVGAPPADAPPADAQAVPNIVSPDGTTTAGTAPVGEAPPGTPADGTQTAGPVPPGGTMVSGPPVAAAPQGAASYGDDGIGSPQLFIGLGVGILALVGIGWLWAANRRRQEDEIPTPLPEPGLLGPATPSLSGGASTWRTDAAALPELAWGLVGRIARHRRVVLATTEGIEVPPVFGGPVYKAPKLDANEIADLADALEEAGGAPVAVVLVGDEAASTLTSLRAELAAGTGLVLVGSTKAPVEPQALRCTREGQHWVIEGPDGRTTVRPGTSGFELLEAEAA